MNSYCEKNVVLIDNSKLNENSMFILETYREHYKDTHSALLRRPDYLRWSYILDKIKDNVSILDIGVGAGQFVNMLALSNKPLTSISGLDIRPHSGFIQMFDHIQMHYHSVVNMEFPDNHFDVVTCLEVLEHLDDKNMAIAISELRRVAKKNLIITVPYNEATPLPKHHLQSFSYSRLNKLFPKAEFTFFCIKDNMSWVLIEENFNQKPDTVITKIKRKFKK
ncbi:MAG: class I SAM-dependent methyltransferase [Litorimonas sp.]